MSPNVGNFVQDLVHMAQATERLPQVEEALQIAEKIKDDLVLRVQEREESILKLKAEINELNSKVQAAEVARDDAELRFLELDEKAGKVSAVLDSLASMAMGAFDQLTPPKPEPTPEPEPVKAEPAPMTYADWAEKTAEAPQGQSESHPTVDVQGSEISKSGTASSQPAAEQEPASPASTSDGPYSGKFYYDHPVYVSLSDWLAGGGSEENYYRSKPTPQKDYSGAF